MVTPYAMASLDGSMPDRQDTMVASRAVGSVIGICGLYIVFKVRSEDQQILSHRQELPP